MEKEQANMALRSELDEALHEVEALEEEVEDKAEALQLMLELLKESRIETVIAIETQSHVDAFRETVMASSNITNDSTGDSNNKQQESADIRAAQDQLLEETLEELEVQRELNLEIRASEHAAQSKIEELERDWAQTSDENHRLRKELDEANQTVVQSSAVFAQRADALRANFENDKKELMELREHVRQQRIEEAGSSDNEEALKQQLNRLVDEARSNKLSDMQALHESASRINELQGELTASKREIAEAHEKLSTIRVEYAILEEAAKREDHVSSEAVTQAQERLADAEDVRAELTREVEMLKRELHSCQAQLDSRAYSRSDSPATPRNPSNREPSGALQRLFCCFKSNQVPTAYGNGDHPGVDHQRLVEAADDDSEHYR